MVSETFTKGLELTQKHPPKLPVNPKQGNKKVSAAQLILGKVRNGADVLEK